MPGAAVTKDMDSQWMGDYFCWSKVDHPCSSPDNKKEFIFEWVGTWAPATAVSL